MGSGPGLLLGKSGIYRMQHREVDRGMWTLSCVQIGGGLSVQGIIDVYGV